MYILGILEEDSLFEFTATNQNTNLLYVIFPSATDLLSQFCQFSHAKRRPVFCWISKLIQLYLLDTVAKFKIACPTQVSKDIFHSSSSACWCNFQVHDDKVSTSGLSNFITTTEYVL